MSNTYPVRSRTFGHDIIKARTEHSCYGVPQKVNRFWVSAVSPICSGIIHPGDLYMSFNNPLTRQFSKACLPCVLHYEYSDLEGDLAEYRPVTAEQIEEARVELEADVMDLLEEKHLEPLHSPEWVESSCRVCGVSLRDPQPRGIGFLTDERCRCPRCKRFTLE